MVLYLGVSEERNVYHMINFEVLMGMSEVVEGGPQTEAVVKIASQGADKRGLLTRGGSVCSVLFVQSSEQS